jgi:hypothetical protein
MKKVKSLELRVKSYARSCFATNYYLISEHSELKIQLLTLNSKLLTFFILLTLNSKLLTFVKVKMTFILLLINPGRKNWRDIILIR